MPAHTIRLSVHGAPIVIRSLGEAASFIRTHPMSEHAGTLLDQIGAASRPELASRAWLAVATFADAMQRSGKVTLSATV